MNRLALLLYSLPMLCMGGAASSQELNGPARIIDGDTLVVSGQKVRLHGIDTPETKQPCTRAGVRFDCGQLSTDALRRIVDGRAVKCVASKRDRYKRWIGKCFVGSLDIQSELTRQGWAFAYRKYSTDYARDEVKARKDRAGLWEFEIMKPWDYRRTPEFRKRFTR